MKLVHYVPTPDADVSLIQPNEDDVAPCENSSDDRDIKGTDNEQAQPEVSDADEPK